MRQTQLIAAAMAAVLLSGLALGLEGDALRNYQSSQQRARQMAAELVADAIVGTAFGGFTSKLTNYDFRVNGKLFDLPAGALDIAIGGEVRQESLSAIACCPPCRVSRKPSAAGSQLLKEPAT